MSRSIWKKQSLANRASRSILVPILAVFLLGWFGLGFSLQDSLCTHADEKAAMHGGGLCTWLCAAYGQDLSVRLPEWPAVQAQAGFSADRTASGLRASFLDALENRGPPMALPCVTVSA
jgi:hypothetical protein